MTDKINKELHLSESMQNLKEKIRKHKLMRWKRIITAAFLGFMIIFGSYLLLEYRTYENTRVIRTYKGDSSADGSYKMFRDSVLKYTKDGMTLIDQKGKKYGITLIRSRIRSLRLIMRLQQSETVAETVSL